MDLASGKLLHYYNHQNEIGMRVCSLSPNGYLLAVGACDGSISVIEMDSYKHLKLVQTRC